jgi:DNA-binding HxlR family transcriptional regulator
MAEFATVGDVFLADCPARLAVEIIANKWSVVIIFGLSKGPRRHGDLLALVGGISKKVLTQTLRRLEAFGIVERLDRQYALTSLGATLISPIGVLTDWAAQHGEAVNDARGHDANSYL